MSEATYSAEDVQAVADRTPATRGDVSRMLFGLADEVGKATGGNGRQLDMLNKRVDGLESSVLSLLADLQAAVDALKAQLGEK